MEDEYQPHEYTHSIQDLLYGLRGLRTGLKMLFDEWQALDDLPEVLGVDFTLERRAARGWWLVGESL